MEDFSLYHLTYCLSKGCLNSIKKIVRVFVLSGMILTCGWQYTRWGDNNKYHLGRDRGCFISVNQRFGDLLTEGIISIAKRQRKTVAAVEREIAQALGFTSQHINERWRRGYVAREPEQVAFLARSCVSRGRVDLSWASSLLTQARYYARETLLQELFHTTSSRTEGLSVYEHLPPRYAHELRNEM